MCDWLFASFLVERLVCGYDRLSVNAPVERCVEQGVRWTRWRRLTSCARVCLVQVLSRCAEYLLKKKMLMQALSNMQSPLSLLHLAFRPRFGVGTTSALAFRSSGYPSVQVSARPIDGG